MSERAESTRIAVLGGTGPHGRGLASRLAMAGYDVAVGSRSKERARETIDRLPTDVARSRLRGAANVEAARWAEVVVVAVPHTGLAPLAADVGTALIGKPVLCCVNPLTFDDLGPVPVTAANGSAAEDLATACPGAQVVSAFQNVAARKLADLEQTLSGDVLLCSDHEDALKVAADIVASLSDLRPVHAGPLRLSGVVEHLTVVLLSINRRYRTLTSIVIEGLESPRHDRTGSTRDVA